jgi:hypothetical protein
MLDNPEIVSWQAAAMIVSSCWGFWGVADQIKSKGHLSADGRLPIRSSAAPRGSSHAAAIVRRIWLIHDGYAALAQRRPLSSKLATGTA